jgi:hypothetical protein
VSALMPDPEADRIPVVAVLAKTGRPDDHQPASMLA